MIEQSAIHVYVKKTHGQPSFRCYYSVEENLLRGRLKSNNVVMPRQIAMYLIRELTHQSYKNIGREFGRDHTTVISSLQKVEALIAKNDKETLDNLRDITANINSKL